MSDGERKHLWKVVRERAQAGNADALNVLGSLYVDEALRLKDEALLDAAEDNFKKAAIAGHSVASEFVRARWPELKEKYAADIREAKSRNQGRNPGRTTDRS